MTLLHARTPLTAAERLAKRRLIVQDTLALTGLFVITVLFAVLTYLLFQSYSQHQKDAAARWLRRGESALRAGKPLSAVYALRSALAYAPTDRRTEIELAKALADSGNIQEATVYFNALWEAEPGNGQINLELARLALASHRIPAALQYYHASIYGTWEGDGAKRRREVRLELVNHLIDLHRYSEARDELLIAAGNAGDNDVADRLRIAGLLLEAHAPADALHLYRDLAARKPAPVEAVQGAGRTAVLLGRYLEAKQYLERAVAAEAATEHKGAAEPTLDADRQQLAEVNRLLALYPSSGLAPKARAERVLADRRLAKQRLDACAEQLANTAGASAPAAAPPGNAGQGAATRPGAASPGTTGSPATGAKAAAQPVTAGPLAPVVAQWASQGRRLTVADLVEHPDRMQSEIELIYGTELATNAVCGPPAGDDALLLKIAQAPDAVEQP